MRKCQLTKRLKLFSEGNCHDAYRFMGCHAQCIGGASGFIFRVWAPHAKSVRVVGSFNGWATSVPAMTPIGNGLWEQFIPGVKEGDQYKYHIERPDGSFVYKCDPYGFQACSHPEPNSVVCSLDGFEWTDQSWRRSRGRRPQVERPINIYELHLGSWRQREDGSYLSYEEYACELAEYASSMGYTHIELLPISEYPYDPSWGYQVTGYYAPTSRYGSPKDFMKFVDICHNAGIGVILDWVGGHFPRDEQGLFEFDGGFCYESPDPLLREHPEWGTRIFDYSRYEVRSFLLSNAVYWLDLYHVDGIRVDAVASMLYLNYGRKEGQWRPNREGGNINLDAVRFLQDLNAAAYSFDPHVLMIAEESTAFPLVTRPGYDGGLGFTFKWNMGWMHDTLDYMSVDPLFRKGSHDKLTFSICYAFSENFILPLSHDEVVHCKHSLLEKMPGGYEDKFHNLRAYYGYMMAHPGKKLLFMGGEFGQFIEWDYKKQLDWFLTEYDTHRGLRDYVKDLNHFYQAHPALWRGDAYESCFHWLSCDDKDHSVVAFVRRGKENEQLMVVCNFCPVERKGYRIGVDQPGRYVPLLSSDDAKYGGSGTPLSPVSSQPIPMHGKEHSVELTLPPLSTVYFRRTGRSGK